jgi:tRNA pseudouridine55 synthase
VLLLDKPRGVTSNHALQRVKRLYDAAKAGHTGSLDPLATGMLPICFGAATKLGAFLLDARKSYRVTACLGVATDTDDADGTVIERRDDPPASEGSVRAALARFVGEIEQVPPMYSALKRDGVPLYRLARRGVTVEREARRVTIETLSLERFTWPELDLAVRCSKGTYVRTLVVDLAAALGTVGHVRELRRTAVDPFTAEQMTPLDALEELAARDDREALDRLLLPADSAVAAWPAVVLGPAAAARLVHGQAVAADPAWPVGRTKVYREPHDLLGLAEVTPDGRLVPRRMFPS